MTRSDVAGWLLVGSFAFWLPAGALPSRVWTAPIPERLALIARRPRRWQLVNLSIAAAAVLLALGFVAVASPLEQSGAGVDVALSLAVLLLGVSLWLISLAFRITVTTSASSGGLPAGFAAVSAWAGALFLGWTILGNAAIAGFGAAVVQSGYPATWCGWVVIVLVALIVVQLVVTGDSLPVLYHVGPLVLGVTLLVD